jgi:hypothetical protein
MDQLPRRTRTYSPLIKGQMNEGRNVSSDNTFRIATPPVSQHNPTDTCQNDPDLAALVDAWPTLPEALKDAVMPIVQSASRGG